MDDYRFPEEDNILNACSHDNASMFELDNKLYIKIDGTEKEIVGYHCSEEYRDVKKYKFRYRYPELFQKHSR